MPEPVSIRYKNPGAMWGGNKIAKKWGATADVLLHDGEANHAAVFPTKVQGAAAQFDLWRNLYCGMSLESAIRKWCGGNSPAAYVSFLKIHADISETEIITQTLLKGPKGLALMKAQAQWEAGRPYPMTDAEWRQAQNLVFPGYNPAVPPDIPAPKPAQAPSGWSAILAAILSIFKRA